MMAKKKKKSPAEIRADAQVELVKSLSTAVTTRELLEAADAVGKQAKRALKEDRKLLKEIQGSLGPESKG